MPNLDPAAATAAYLAEIPPETLQRAIAYTEGSHWLLLWGWLVTLLACWLILRSGALAALSVRLQRGRPRPILASFLLGLVFLLLDWLLELPWDAYAHWGRETAYGLTHQSFAGWLGEQALGAGINAVFGGLFLIVFYALARRLQHSWPLWAGAAATIFFLVLLVLAPVFIEPLFNDYTPAPAGPIRDAVTALARETGTPPDKIFIYNGSKQSDRYTANVSGAFGTARVAMSDTMFRQGVDLAEVRAVVGHEMGHYVHGHALVFALAFGLLGMAGFELCRRLFGPAARLFGAGARSIADPAGLPVLWAMLATLGLIGSPALNTLIRFAESDADHFSLVHANEPDAMARVLLKTVEYRAPSPSTLEEFLFYDHPSVEHRILAAMQWKAAPEGR